MLKCKVHIKKALCNRLKDDTWLGEGVGRVAVIQVWAELATFLMACHFHLKKNTDR